MAIYSLPAGYEDMISIKGSYSTESRHRQVEFGDGYIQRTPLGINSLIRNLDVLFENLTQAEKNSFIPFCEFIQRNGHSLIIPANEMLASTAIYVIETMNVESVDGDKTNVSLSLREVFDL